MMRITKLNSVMLSYTRSYMIRNSLLIQNNFMSTHQQDKNIDFKCIFAFPFIKQAAAVNKIKIYQAAFSLCIVPLSYFAESGNIIPESSFLVALSIGVSGTITLTILSLILDRLIGFIYINEHKDSVKISYLDFLGRRKNIELNVSELVPLNEFKQKKFLDFYDKVKLYDNSKKEYKIVHKYGGIKDYSDFKLIFGDTS